MIAWQWLASSPEVAGEHAAPAQQLTPERVVLSLPSIHLLPFANRLNTQKAVRHHAASTAALRRPATGLGRRGSTAHFTTRRYQLPASCSHLSPGCVQQWSQSTVTAMPAGHGWVQVRYGSGQSMVAGAGRRAGEGSRQVAGWRSSGQRKQAAWASRRLAGGRGAYAPRNVRAVAPLNAARAAGGRC